MGGAKQVSRRGVLAGTAGLGVGAGLAAVTPSQAMANETSKVGDGASILGVGVAFTQWGTIYLGPGVVQDWWFTWYFSANRWSRMSALPVPESPAGSSVEIVAEWANSGTLNVRFRNNSSVGVIFRPTVIVAPE